MLILCAVTPGGPADAQSAQGASTPLRSAPVTLPGTRPLTWTGDLSARMVDGAHRYLDRKLAASVRDRQRYWRRDLSSRSAYEKSVAPNRARLLAQLGATDPRVTPEMHLDPEPVAETPSYRVRAARWPVLAPVKPLPPEIARERQSWPLIDGPKQVEGEGLLIVPSGSMRGYVVVLPDADQTPEEMIGLAPGIPPESQMARRLAENGFTVLIPTLIDRGHTYSHAAFSTDLSHREWIYRQGFEMGQTVIGYEVQKVRAAVDWFRAAGRSHTKIAVAGYGEGGLIALYAAALDTRIDAALVSGYFKPRERAWEEPLYRNVWGLLHEFGDAEIATLIAPRPLVIEYSAEPDVVSGGIWPAPGRLTTPSVAAVRAEFRRIDQLTRSGFQPKELVSGPNGAPLPFGSHTALKKLTTLLGDETDLSLSPHLPTDSRKDFHPEARQERQVKQLENHIQLSLQTVEVARERNFLARMDTRSVEAFTQGAKKFRKRFYSEAIGKLDDPLLPMNPRTRRIYDEPTWTGYDVVLEVWPDVFAWGVLCVPKDIRPGEKRPVVVCQHGLEGLPRDTIEQTDGYPYYKSFTKQLVERGYITFAPHNLYRGGVRFRMLQRKANLLKASLFSIITPQHEQILNFLGSLDYVDRNRIAFYGLSYGGKTAMRVPALLDRYCLSICSGDFNEWVRVNTTVHSEYSYLNRSAEWEMPEWDLAHTFNYAEMAALILPRPFMVERGHQDGVAPDDWVAYEYSKVRQLYERLGIADRTEIEFFDGPHTIHGVGAFAFLAKHLRWPPEEHP